MKTRRQKLAEWLEKERISKIEAIILAFCGVGVGIIVIECIVIEIIKAISRI
jgi:uncharacterized protein YutD